MKQAIVLAGGEGRRLRPFTVNKPKAMIFIAGKPIIQYVIEALEMNGIHDVILVVGYRREQVYDYIGDGKQFGINVTYVTQGQQLGPADALLCASKVADDNFLLLHGDKLIAADTITQIIKEEPAAILVKKAVSTLQYGVVTVDDGKLTRFMKHPSSIHSNMIDLGIYSLNKEVFGYIDSGLDIPDALNAMLKEHKNIKAIESQETWLDVVYPWDILSLNRTILERVVPKFTGIVESGVILKGKVSLGKNTIVRSNTYITGPVVIGDGCEIGPNVCIYPSTSIANNVVISPFSELKNCVIGNDVFIHSGASIQDTIIDKGCGIGSHFCASSEETEIKVDTEHHNIKVGAMIGECCEIDNHVVAQPGVIVGNYCHVKSLKILSGRLSDKSLIV